MAKSTTSKTTSKTARKTPSKPASKKTAESKPRIPAETNPRVAVKRTLTSASKLVEAMIKAIEEEMKKPHGQADEDHIFGPRGAIANLHKLMQVLDKLSDQLKSLEGDKKPAATSEPLSKEEFKLLEEWLKQPQ